MAQRNLRLALLICDTPVPAVREKYGTYLEVFKTYLRNSLAADTGSTSSIDFTLEGFDVVHGAYPDKENFQGEKAFDGILISGSAASAHGPEPWIKDLISFVKSVIEDYPDVKLVGICFGHQIIAQAMGGQCTRNDNGWEIGTTMVDLTEAGREVFGAQLDTLEIQQMHRDHVPSVPPTMELLGSSPIAPVHGLVSRYPSGEIHIFTVQGHPEFSPDIVHKIIDAREASGVLDAETVKVARVKASKRDDGIGHIGHAIWRVLEASHN